MRAIMNCTTIAAIEVWLTPYYKDVKNDEDAMRSYAEG